MGAQLPHPTDASCRAPIDAPTRAPMCSPPYHPPPQSAPCPIATHHCSRSRCVTRCPHPAQRWLWAEPRVAAVWGGGGIGHRGAGLGYGMEGDASAHCAPRCDGGCGGDAVCGAQSCSGTAQRAKGGGGGGGHQSRGDFLPLFGLIPTGAAVRGPPKHRGCSHPTERSAEQLQQCSAGGAALLPAQSRKWVPVQQKGQQSPQPSPPPPFQGAKPHSFLCSTTAGAQHTAPKGAAHRYCCACRWGHSERGTLVPCSKACDGCTAATHLCCGPSHLRAMHAGMQLRSCSSGWDWGKQGAAVRCFIATFRPLRGGKGDVPHWETCS